MSIWFNLVFFVRIYFTIIIELTFVQHQYNNHTTNKLHETGLDMKITEHVVDVFLDFVPIDVQEQGKGEGFVDFITVGNKI